jgi:hypothetical protein
VGKPVIDTTNDFASERPPHLSQCEWDPDKWSETLREYHCLLWSGPLPGSDVACALASASPPQSLALHSGVSEFSVSSDSIVITYACRESMQHLTSVLPPDELATFFSEASTIGGRIIFPSKRIEGQTINQRRGFHPWISDRFDLTLECIRLHFSGDYTSPIGRTLRLYAAFFDLFGDFRKYVDFFLLRDLVTSDYSAVRFFLPFQGFGANPLPQTTDEYLAFRDASVNFVRARNARIDQLGL